MLRTLTALILAATSLAGQAPPAAPAPPATPPSATLATPPSTPAEIAVVREINKIRRFPKEYAKYLRALGTRFEGTLWRLQDTKGRLPIRTNEGRDAVMEAVAFLENVDPVMELITYDETLHLAALDHVRDQGPTGQTGHKGTDGSKPSDRIKRYAGIKELSAEVINYGEETPRIVDHTSDRTGADKG